MTMIFNKADIAKMKLNRTPNKVLVKPTRGSNEILLPGGMKIYMDDRFGKEKHAPTTGIVANNCGKLMTARLPWETTNEIEIGDYIIYSFESAMCALDDAYGSVLFDEDGDVYLFIDYEDIFIARRNDVIIPVNGYLLVSAIEEKESSGFEIMKENKNSSRYGLVEYVGSRNLKYMAVGKTREDIFDFEEEIKQGDIIVFNRDSDLPAEYSLHKSLGTKTFFRLQRKDIDGIIPENEKNKFGL